MVGHEVGYVVVAIVDLLELCRDASLQRWRSDSHRRGFLLVVALIVSSLSLRVEAGAGCHGIVAVDKGEELLSHLGMSSGDVKLRLEIRREGARREVIWARRCNIPLLLSIGLCMSFRRR